MHHLLIEIIEHMLYATIYTCARDIKNIQHRDFCL